MGLFNKIKNVFSKDKEAAKYEEGLTKTRKEFSTELAKLSKKYKNIDDDYFEELENILIMADIGVNTVVKFVDKLKKRVKEENIKDSETLKEIIIDELLIMYVNNGVLKSKINYSEEGPTVILFIGVNGVGKTTSIGKIANKLKKEYLRKTSALSQEKDNELNQEFSIFFGSYKGIESIEKCTEMIRESTTFSCKDEDISCCINSDDDSSYDEDEDEDDEDDEE